MNLFEQDQNILISGIKEAAALVRPVFGRSSATISLQHSSWDVAAGVVMAREAGLIVTNLDGTEVNLEQNRKLNLITATPEIHSDLVELLKDVEVNSELLN